jgi:hypothetical protein
VTPLFFERGKHGVQGSYSLTFSAVLGEREVRGLRPGDRRGAMGEAPEWKARSIIAPSYIEREVLR